MTLKTKFFKPGHLDFFEARAIFDNEVDLDRLDGSDPNSLIYSLIDDGMVVGIFGLKKMWPGVGELWSVTSNLASKKPIAFHKACIELLNAHIDVLKLHRIQCSVRSDYLPGIKWIESLGFKEEGYMHKYGSNKLDYIRYARVEE